MTKLLTNLKSIGSLIVRVEDKNPILFCTWVLTWGGWLYMPVSLNLYFGTLVITTLMAKISSGVLLAFLLIEARKVYYERATLNE